MRVICTQMYFDEDDVRGYEGMFHRRRPPFSEEKNPGVAFASFQNQEVLAPEDVDNMKAFHPLIGTGPIRPTKEQVRGLLDLFIRDADERQFIRIPNDSSLENRNLVEFLLQQEIVMEHSPPFSISLKGVIDSANTPVWIGTLAGFGAGWEHPVLLLLTVPGGIIAVASARGIGQALEMGLNKFLKRLLDKKP